MPLPLAQTPAPLSETNGRPIARGAPFRVTNRDAVVDVLRGLSIVAMISDHAGKGYIFALFHLQRYTTAAALFVFLSGWILGVIHPGRIAKLGGASVYRRIVRRAVDLWVVHGVTTILVYLLHDLFGLFPGLASVGRPASWAEMVWQIATLQLQPSPMYLQVLPLYVLLIGSAPVVLVLLDRGKLFLVIALVSSLYLVSQTAIGDLHPVANGRDFRGYYPLAWQVIFFGGLILGYYKEWFVTSLSPRQWRWTVGISTFVFVALVVIARREWLLPSLVAFGEPNLTQFFERSRLRPGSLLMFAVALAPLFAAVRSLCQHPIWVLILAPFAFLGRNSLYVFQMHLLVLYLLMAFGVSPGSKVGRDLIVVLVVGAVYIAARKNLLRSVLSR